MFPIDMTLGGDKWKEIGSRIQSVPEITLGFKKKKKCSNVNISHYYLKILFTEWN